MDAYGIVGLRLLLRCVVRSWHFSDFKRSPDASSDALRQRVRCSGCGSKGATLQIPSWVASEIGLAPYSTKPYPKKG